MIKTSVANIFIFMSYSLYTQVMLILILIVVQCLQNVVFCFEKGLNGQNYSSGLHHPRKKNLPSAKCPTL